MNQPNTNDYLSDLCTIIQNQIGTYRKKDEREISLRKDLFKLLLTQLSLLKKEDLTTKIKQSLQKLLESESNIRSWLETSPIDIEMFHREAYRLDIFDGKIGYYIQRYLNPCVRGDNGVKDSLAYLLKKNK